MKEKLQENHEILNYFMYKKIENIEELLKDSEVNWDTLLSACRKQVERELVKVGKKYGSSGDSVGSPKMLWYDTR